MQQMLRGHSVKQIVSFFETVVSFCFISYFENTLNHSPATRTVMTIPKASLLISSNTLLAGFVLWH